MDNKKKECPSCAMPVEAKAKVCPICQFEFPQRNSLYAAVAVLLAVLLLALMIF